MSAGEITAICAVAIAFFSLILTISQVRETKKNNRLSVKPFLDVTYNTFSNKPAEIILENRGIGPAIITRLACEIEEQLVECKTFEDLKRCVEIAINESLADYLSQIGDEEKIQFNKTYRQELFSRYVSAVHLGTNSPLSPESPKTIVSIDRDSKTNELIQIIQDNAVRRMVFILGYESIYGEKFTGRALPPPIKPFEKEEIEEES